VKPETISVRSLRLVVGAILIALIAGCGGEQTPEDRVRNYIDQVAESAGARNWRDFDEYVADDYSDARGLQKKDVLAIVTRYILVNQHIHILKRIASVRVEDSGDAHAVVYAAMAGQPVSGPEDFARIKADFYRFEIDLSTGDDGDFRTRSGDWKPVAPDQFLLGR